MPALAGTARMRYLKFLAFNAAGGIVWGIGFTLLGFLAGNSYKTIEKSVGRGAAIAIAAFAVVALIVWRIREHRRDKTGEATDGAAAVKGGAGHNDRDPRGFA